MRPNVFSSQRGFNLIELMIAIVIGLFISLMVVQYLVTSAKLFKQQGSDTNLEANGTFAISYMTQYLRQAGTNDPIGSDVPFYIGDCIDFDPCTANSDTPGASDRVAVQMFPFNGRDCIGEVVEDGHRIANVFYLEDNSLYCRGFDETEKKWLSDEGEALIDGIEQMQILYGVSNDDGQIDRYVDASRVAPVGVSTNDALEAWDRVRSVKLALLVFDGADSGAEIAEETKYQLLDFPVIVKNDRVARKVYSTTITINNKLP